MSGFTPGPWRIEGSLVVADWGVIVKQAAAYDDAIADLRLIAAAPELLGACKAIVEAAEEGDSLTAGMLAGCAMHMAEAAIARATGEQP